MSGNRSTREWHAVPPFQDHLGIEPVEMADGHAILRLVFKPELGNRKGDFHGGVLATLIDIVMSQSIRSLTPDVAGLSTINMNLNYLEPAGGTVIARGRAVKVGGSVGFAEATCETADGRIVVQGSGAFRIIRHKPASRAKP